MNLRKSIHLGGALGVGVALVGDGLGGVLVNRVVVTGGERLVVAERDLLLSEVALALDALAVHASAVHAVPDVPQKRLNSRAGQQVVINVVVGTGLEVVVALGPGTPIGLVENNELKLGAHEWNQVLGG